MSALARLQARFLQGLLEDRPLAAGDIRGTAAFSVEQRLAVYANAYRRRLVEALASGFEKTASALGADAFEALALAYVEANPPRDRALGRHCDGFPDWLEHHAEGGSGIADLARIEQALQRAFEAADARPLCRDALLGLTPEQWMALRLAMHPSLATKAIRSAAIAAWKTPAGAHATSGAPSAHVTVAFWRKEGQTLFRSLAEDEARLLTRLRSGAEFAEACDLESGAPIAPDTAASFLLAWVDDGWIVGPREPNDPPP